MLLLESMRLTVILHRHTTGDVTLYSHRVKTRPQSVHNIHYKSTCLHCSEKHGPLTFFLRSTRLFPCWLVLGDHQQQQVVQNKQQQCSPVCKCRCDIRFAGFRIVLGLPRVLLTVLYKAARPVYGEEFYYADDGSFLADEDCWEG